MIVKIERSGTGIWKDRMIQVRACGYLEEGDPRYEEHRVPDTEGQTYMGEVTEDGTPIDQADYEKWLETLPKKSNPFHNHLFRVTYTATDSEIIAIANAKMQEAFGKWSSESKILISNKDMPYTIPAKTTATLRASLETRLSEIHSRCAMKYRRCSQNDRD